MNIEFDVFVAGQLDSREPTQTRLLLGDLLAANVVDGDEKEERVYDQYDGDWQSEEYQIRRAAANPATAAHDEDVVRFVLTRPVDAQVSERVVDVHRVLANDTSHVLEERVLQHVRVFGHVAFRGQDRRAAQSIATFEVARVARTKWSQIERLFVHKIDCQRGQDNQERGCPCVECVEW